MKGHREAGRWTEHPSSTFLTAWGLLAVVVYLRYDLGNHPVLPSWDEPPLVVFQQSCSAPGQMCERATDE